MSPAFCEKEKTEMMDRWTSEDQVQANPRGRFWRRPAASRQAIAAMHYIAAMLLALCLIFVSSDAAGQTAVDASETPLPAGIDIQAKATPEIAAVGDPLQIDLDIAAPKGYRVQIAEPEKQMGDFAILEFFPGPIVTEPETALEPISTETLHHRARIVAAVYKTGKFVFPSFPIKLQTPGGEEITLSSPRLNIEIRSILNDKNPQLKDLKKQAEIPESVRWMLWLVIALAAILLGAIIWHYWRKRRLPSISYSPEQMQDLLDLAEADLRELLSRGLPEKSTVKEFYVLLSEIVKRILESGYEIPTAEQTTSEIMDSLHRKPELELENKERIESFLLRCDVVKFAKYVPSTAEHETVSKDALQILAQARAVVSRQLPVSSRN